MTLKKRTHFRSASRALALEARLLFDGAGAVAVVDGFDNGEDNIPAPEAPAATPRPDEVLESGPEEALEPGAQADEADEADVDTDTDTTTSSDSLGSGDSGNDTTTQTDDTDSTETVPNESIEGESGPAGSLLIIDSRVADQETLLAEVPSNVTVRVIDSNESGIDAVGEELAKGGVFDAIHIVSHGTPGSLTLGSDTIDNNSINSHNAALQSWASYLTADADILLYGCDIAQGEPGQILLNQLAHLTGADIAASTNATGAEDQGGDWVLEAATGNIEAMALSVAGFGELLAAPNPTVAIYLPDGSDILMGEGFDFTLTFTNPGGDGFGPYIDLFLPKGADGDVGGPHDGITIAPNGAITYLNSPVNYQIITLDGTGKADHPYARNTSGTATQINGSAGQEVVVIELPFGSYTSGQPDAVLNVSAKLSNLADRGAPVDLKAQAGFRYGATPAADYADDPSVTGAMDTESVNPTLVEYTYSFDGPEGETVTGPNFPREMTTTITVAPGQTLTDYEFKIDVPSNIIVTHLDGVELATPVTGGALSENLGNLTGSKAVTIRYYVPDVLNATTGEASTSEFNVSGEGEWTPLDNRDDPETVGNDPAGIEFSHPIKSLAVQKSVENKTDSKNSPGDELEYTLDFQVSDYFSFKDVVIADVIEDGHGLTGVPSLVLKYQGIEHTISLATFYTDTTDGTTHDITRSFNISAAIAAYASTKGLSGDIADGKLTGGKFNGLNLGETTGQIIYTAEIKDQFESPVNGDPAINHGDNLATEVIIRATVVNENNIVDEIVTDKTDTNIDIASGGLTLEVVNVNGSGVPAEGIKPGDTVTYELTYDLATGDYENLKLDAYLPKPVFDLNTGDIITGVWTKDSVGTGTPAVGHWMLVSGTGLLSDAATDSNATLSPVDPDSNALKFNLGTRDDTTNKPTKVVIRFTVQVQNDPFADGLYLTAQAQAQDNNTPGEPTKSQDIVKIQLNEPMLSIKHGIVSKTQDGTISGTTGTWVPPGDAGKPFDGTLTSIDGIDGNITNIDAGDTVTFAVGIINTGGHGAFDIKTGIIGAPDGFKLIKGDGNDAANISEANLRLYRGDGVELRINDHYTISGSGEITLIDIDIEDDATLAAGLSAGRVGETAAVDGKNIVVITYDAVALAAIAAGRVSTSTVSVVDYTNVEGGTDFLPGTNKISDTANATVAVPTVKIVFKDGAVDNTDSDSPSTEGADMVIGESMLYDIVVTLPEGTTHDLNVQALVPDGMMLDTSYQGTGTGTVTGAGYEIITVKGTDPGESGALTGDFIGSFVPADFSVSDNTGNLSADPVFKFGDVTTTGDNETANNSFVIRVRLIAANTNSTVDGGANNQDGETRTPSVSLTYDKGGDDTNTPVSASAINSMITIREPKLVVVKTVDTNVITPGVQTAAIDAGDTIEYTIKIEHGADSFDAYDLGFSDVFNSVLTMNSTFLITIDGVAVSQAVLDQFEWNGNELRTIEDANIDLAKGQVLEIKVQGTAKASVAAVSAFDSDATVRWSSMDSANNSESAKNDNERDGSGGFGADTVVLNNYVAKDGAEVKVAAEYNLSRIGGLEDTDFTGNTESDEQYVAVGEIVRFRLVMRLPEGEIPDLSMVPKVPGYELLDTGATWALMGEADTFTVNGGAANNFVPGSNPGNIENTLNSSTTPTASDRPGGAATLTGGAFLLGSIRNNDTDNSKAEYIVLEFNAIVRNDAANTAGKELNSQVEVFTGTTKLGESNITKENVVEPQISAITKDVIDTAPGAQDVESTITVRNSFTTGSTNATPAYEVKLVDSFPGAGESADYAFAGLTIGGTTYTTIGTLPSGVVTWSQSDSGIEVNFAEIDPGITVEVLYTAKVPTTVAQTAVTVTDATLTWSSLPDGAGSISETGFAGSSVGADATASGERDGSGTDPATNPNTYVRTDPAGYGIISGTLWDDTNNRDGSIDPGEVRLDGVTVTLRWAGADGTFGETDDRVLTTVTDANGNYTFGALPLGNYRIETPSIVDKTIGGDPDALTPRFDTDGAGNGLGIIAVTLTEGQTTANRNVGYLQVNDAPTVTITGEPPVFVEGIDTLDDREVLGTPVNLGTVDITDVDLEKGLDNYADTTLTVARSDGTSDFDAQTQDVLGFDTSIGISGATISVGGTVVGTFTNTAGRLVVTFNASADKDKVNAVASAITYANSSDTPPTEAIVRYRFNDANDDSKQGSGGELVGDATIKVNITPQNDPPLATDDINHVTEDSGIPATGNVRTDGTPDSDPDNDISELSLSGIRTGPETGGTPGTPQTITVGTNSGNGTVVTGQYGTLTIGADGSYSYVLDNSNPAVNALNDGETLDEVFTYTLRDPDNATDIAQLTITIDGRTDGSPTIVPVDGNGADATGQATVYEKGLTSPGDTSETTGGAITVTAPDGIDTVTIGGTTFTVAELQGFTPGSPSAVIDTGKGELRITGITTVSGSPGAPTEANVIYTYTLKARQDHSTAPGIEVQDDIALVVTDKSSTPATSNGTLTIQIIDDVPTAVNDASSITKGTATVGGNAFTNDRIGADGPGTPGQPVTAIAGGVLGAPVAGSYGAITLNADGTYSYALNNGHPAVAGLLTGQKLTETFKYTITDQDGDVSEATITITIKGQTPNDVPVAVDDSFTLDKEGPFDGTLKGNDKPSKDGGNVWTKTTNPSNGTATVNPDGTFTYTPKPGFTGTDSFTYTITDKDGDKSTATVTIRVTKATMPPTQPAVPMPPAPGVDAPINSPLQNSPVINDSSVFFPSERFGDVVRMPLPFSAVEYVKQQVDASQNQRALDDPRNFSDLRAFDLNGQGMTSQTIGLGFDPALFVTHAVRDSQRQADFFSNTVAGRYARTDLSNDGYLPRIGMFRDQLLELSELFKERKKAQPADAPAAADGADAKPVDAKTSDAGTVDEAVAIAVQAAQAVPVPAEMLLPISRSGAPSFTEQLRSGVGRLPMATRQS